jgi:hypothetical protein
MTVIAVNGGIRRESLFEKIASCQTEIDNGWRMFAVTNATYDFQLG